MRLLGYCGRVSNLESLLFNFLSRVSRARSSMGPTRCCAGRFVGSCTSLFGFDGALPGLSAVRPVVHNYQYIVSIALAS